MFDTSTGLELELLLPPHLGRLELAAELADWAGARLQIFAFPSKVPVPDEDDPDRAVALIESIAAHHQAMVQSVAEDGRHFYLLHRAARLLDDEGRTLLSVVHDNTLAGGERVAELVTPPFLRARLPWVRALIERVAAVEGVTLPEEAALHVHADGRPFLDAKPLSTLVDTFCRSEPELRLRLRTPPGLRAARPLPPELVTELRVLASRDAGRAEVQALLARHVPDRGFALNLYNLLGDDPDKLTVELKLAAATLDPDRVVEARELMVGLVEV